jgi:adenosylhomocysteine nucleosidase
MKATAPRIALVAALHEELASVLAQIPDEHKETIGRRDFWVGHLHGQDVVATLSGIGKVAAATTATLLIQRFGVNRIVFTGVAGGLGNGVKVGDVVVAQTLLQHDYDVSPIFPRYVIPGHGLSEFPTNEALSTSGAGVVAATP